MQFQFEGDLPHQQAAIAAVVDLFEGQKGAPSTFTVSPVKLDTQLALDEAREGYGNRLRLLDEDLLANLHAVQERGAIEPSAALRVAENKKAKQPAYGLDFTVEMETGTGKTYVYLRTIFELNAAYGFSKFVIVVPSVAIREGVKKSIQQTEQHFRDRYDGRRLNSFTYSRDDLARVRDFAASSDIQVMIVTIQSINSANNVFYDAEREQTFDKAAVDWVAETRPILIVDEPQSVEGGISGQGRGALIRMKPLATIRYTATPRVKYHPVYRLDAFDAHERGLVKSIEVDGAKIQDADGTAYVRLIRIEAVKNRPARARVELSVQNVGGVARDERWVGEDDLLEEASGGRTIYAGLRVGFIDKGAGTMQLFRPGAVETLRVGEAVGDVDPRALARAMVRQTIEHHFTKELRLRPQGIKVLSLFFIGQVVDYRLYPDGVAPAPGWLATVFEEEYAKLAGQERFRSLWGDVPPDPRAAHGGYFAADKRSVTPFEEARTFAASAKDEAVETRTFDLIMRDKERLLDEAEPLRFLFSHSALREGWDNPNVFQICALRDIAAENRRRQSIGRGLRLCVDATGQRRRDEGLNLLTVVSDEGFATFAERLQKEMEEELELTLGVVTPDLFAGMTYPLPGGGTASLSLHESRAVWGALEGAGMVDGDGRVTPALRMGLATENGVPLPPGLPAEAVRLVRERLHRLARKLPVRDANRRGQIQLNLAVLEGHEFQALWSRINRQTTYRLSFKDEALIERCAAAMRDMPAPGEARITFELADVLVGREGVTADRRRASEPRRLKGARLPVPDLLAELVARTELPRRVLAQILIRSGRLDDAGENPAAFLDAATAVIKAGMRLEMVRGIRYVPLEERWAQTLFQPEEDVDGDRLVAVTKAPVDHILFDSETIEKRLALDLEQSDAIRVFAKLPRGFSVSTPLGTYNPDWAIVRRLEDDREEVYLVSETKGDLNNLREAERAKIRCGEAHFASLAVPFVPATGIDGVLNWRAGNAD